MDVDCAKLIRHFSALVSRETPDDVANMIDIAATAPAQRRWRQHPNLLFFMEQTPDDLLQWEMWISQFLVLQRFREDMHLLPFRMVETDVQSFASFLTFRKLLEQTACGKTSLSFVGASEAPHTHP